VDIQRENHPLNIHLPGKALIRTFPQEHGNFVANAKF
jgi:hypothetical protein